MFAKSNLTIHLFIYLSMCLFVFNRFFEKVNKDDKIHSTPEKQTDKIMNIQICIKTVEIQTNKKNTNSVIRTDTQSN